MKLTRRALIKDGLLAVSTGMLMPTIFSRGVASARTLALDGSHFARSASDHTLIVVQMAGGNDGLNTIIPFTDPLYMQMRPTLAIPGTEALPLDTRLGLHPNLKPLARLWDEGHLAIVEGVGYPNQSLSHFQAMDIWQTLDLNGNGSEGWLGKLVAGLVDQNGHPFTGLDIDVQTAQAMQSIKAPVPTVASVESYSISYDPADADRGNARLQALMKLYNSNPGTAPYAALLDTTALSAEIGTRQLHQADVLYRPAVPYPTGPYPSGPFGDGLKILAEAIVQGLGLRVGYITLGGFDTHASQQATHALLLQTLADGLSAFYNDLVAHGKADNVIIMTWSEFGRRVEENGSQGTDHGTAAPLFVMGNSVNKGIFGEPPSLSNLDENGNLKYTVDFRTVYATVLDRWIGASSKDVLGGSFSAQNFLPQP
jgi:uncharacterized protein (DUF1501 family)